MSGRTPSLAADSFSLSLDTWLAMDDDLRDSPRCTVAFAAIAVGIAAYIEEHQTVLKNQNQK